MQSKHEVGNEVLIDKVLIGGAAVWIGDLAFKKNIKILMLGGAYVRGHVDELDGSVIPNVRK